MQIGGRSRRSTAPHVEGMYGCRSLSVSPTVNCENYKFRGMNLPDVNMFTEKFGMDFIIWRRSKEL